MPQRPNLRAMIAPVLLATTSIACALPHADVRFLDGASITDGTVSTMDADAGPPPPMCEAGILCDDACTFTMTDPNHCGACGHRCELAHATAGCVNGQCTIATCEQGWSDCDGNPMNGCETDTQTSTSHCGACRRACTVMNGTSSCTGGVCTIAMCNAGFGDCNMTAADGCETPLNTLTNCGACGSACTAGPNAITDCSMGSCSQRCVRGYADCDGNPSNGCETPLDTATNCGGCGRMCSGSTPVCDAAMGQCVSGCGSLTRCGTTCVDLNMSPSHCGMCGNACPTRANATTTCSAGSCGFTCNPGFADCDGNASNGCEANLNESPSHCGMCGNACPTRANATTTCNMGVCRFTCNPGYADCDGNAANGCETNTQTSTMHCGSCGNVCPTRANATTTCSAGRCGFTCNSGFGDCNMNATDGCETNVNTSPSHCGMCNRACTVMNGTPSCTAGTCGIASCNASFGDCDGMVSNGCETDTQTSTMHCGGCGRMCAPAHATGTCTAGTCTIASCNSGYADCDPAMDGCETDTQTSTMHCGGCGNACPARANATTTCSMGVCGFTCMSNYQDCDDNPMNGCETNTQTDTSHCGMCNRACTVMNGTPSCTMGTCGIASCNAGFGNCDGNAMNGCETNTQTDTSHCGMCGRMCAPANATGTCTAGTCTIASCNAGYADCDPAMDGCETDTQTDNLNCGGCGNTCPLNSTCMAGQCVCASGYSACGGTMSHPAACCDSTTQNCSDGGMCVMR